MNSFLLQLLSIFVNPSRVDRDSTACSLSVASPGSRRGGGIPVLLGVKRNFLLVCLKKCRSSLKKCRKDTVS